MYIYNLYDNYEDMENLQYFTTFSVLPDVIKQTTEHTMKTLEKLRDIDALFLYQESCRFFCHLVLFQSHMIFEWLAYYRKVLDFFHANNLLMFKKEVQFYKCGYRKKKLFKNVNFECYDLKYTKPYYFRYEFIKDFGRVCEIGSRNMPEINFKLYVE